MTALSGWLYDDAFTDILTDDDGAWLSIDDGPRFDGFPAPVTAAYQLDVCTNFVRIGVCDTFTFAAVTARNTTGEWQTRIPEGGVAFDGGATMHDIDSVIVWDISTRPASIVAAGTLNPTGSIDTGIVTDFSSAGVYYTLSGVDLFGLLGTRLAYPDPSTEPPWTDAYDERTGPASTVAAAYIVNNLGASALPARQILGLSVTDPVVGADVTWTARLQPVSTLVTSICNAAEIVCRPRMVTPGVIDYVFTVGADRTAQTIISDEDISGAMTVTAAQARATLVIAGGSGQTTSRTFGTATTGATGLGRIESFYDVSNLTGASAVALAAAGSLAEQSAETAVEFDTLLPRTWRYRTHFDVGDTITVEVAGVRYSAFVDAVAFTISPDRSTVRPIIGRTTNNEASQIMRTLWGTSARFAANIT